MACPYFIPTAPHERELWAHRFRLSLGDGFAGQCGAGSANLPCDDETLRSQCNLGYAACSNLPVEHEFDAVRFQVQRKAFAVLRVQFACEREHLPVFAGALDYDQNAAAWREKPDPRLLLLAEAAVRAWIGRHTSAGED